jgi:hypothetical protein
VTSPAPTRWRDPALILVLTIGALLVAVAIGVVGWSVTSTRRADARGHVVLVETGHADELRVTVDVEKPPSATAECDISAFDAKGKSVGRLVGVLVGPSPTGDRLVRVTVVVPTPLGKGSSAQVATCRLTRAR